MCCDGTNKRTEHVYIEHPADAQYGVVIGTYGVSAYISPLFSFRSCLRFGTAVHFPRRVVFV